MKRLALLLLMSSLALIFVCNIGPFSRAGGVQSKLYVDNSEGDELSVVDTKSFKVLGSIKVGLRPHGLAVSPNGDRIYASVESNNTLVAIDPATGQIVGRAAVGNTPNQITVTADGRFVYVPLRRAAAVDIVDARSMKAIKRVPLVEDPHNSYTSADGKHVYVTTIDGRKIFVFDPHKHEILFEIEPGGKVRPIALTKDDSLMYVALSELHGFAVVDIKQRKTIKRVELPKLPPNTPRPYLDTYTHGLALTPDEKQLWVTSCPGGVVYVYSVPDLKLLGKVEVGKFPNWLAFTPDGKVLFVSNTESNTVTAVDVPGRKVLATIQVGKAPKRLLVLTRLEP